MPHSQASTILVAILFLTVGYCNGLNCGKVTRIISKELYSYLASVQFPSPKPLHQSHWSLEMKTNVPYTFLGGWNVTVETNGANKTANFTSREEVTLKQGEPISFHFRIRWEPEQPTPLVQQLIWEGKEVCQGVAPITTKKRDSENAIRKLRSSSNRRLVQWKKSRLNYA